jgi:hypothetical protein
MLPVPQASKGYLLFTSVLKLVERPVFALNHASLTVYASLIVNFTIILSLK